MEKLAPSHSFLHSFCVRPGAKFETQLEGEEVLLLLRAHPITQIPWVLNGLLLFVFIILLNFLFSSYLLPNQIFFANLSAIVFIFAFYWFKFLSYYFNVGIVTQQRLVDIDFDSVIYKEVTDAKLSNVEDITAKSGGYFASIFNFGDLHVQTAGSHENIEYLGISRPGDVVRIINELTQTAGSSE